MAIAIDRVQRCLADFERHHGRKPKTIAEFRDIKNTAKRMALMDQAAGGPPDVMTFEEESPPLTMDEYFGYADDKSLVWN